MNLANTAIEKTAKMLADNYNMNIPSGDPINRPATRTPLPSLYCPGETHQNIRVRSRQFEASDVQG